MTFATEIDFTADVHVNEKIHLILQIDKINIAITGIIDSARGNIGYFLINFAISLALGTIKFIINNFLSSGFDMNWILKDLIGIDFFYFKAFTLVEAEELIFARLTPGFNITWNSPVNNTMHKNPHLYDLTTIGNFISETAEEVKQIENLEAYVTERLFKALDL